ncbi:MAG: hypothetical protein WC994_08020 [Brumimicrobium sp.]
MKYIISIFVFSILFLFGCNSRKTGKDIKSGFVSFVSKKENLVGYGSVHLEKIIEKSRIKEFEIIGSLVSEYHDLLKGGIELGDRVYYAIEKEEQNYLLYIFLDIKSRDKLRKSLSRIGFFFEKKYGLEKFNSDQFSLMFDDEFALLLLGMKKQDYSKKIEQTFKEIKKSNPNTRVANLLEDKNDIEFLTDLPFYHSTIKKYLPRMEDDKLSEILSEGIIKSTINFKNGKVIGDIHVSHANDSLKNLFFLQKEPKTDLFESLMLQPVDLALKLNFIPSKMDQLIFNYTNHKKGVFNSMGVTGMILKALVGDSLTGFTDGHVGLVLNKQDSTEILNLSVPNTSIFIGLGNNTARMQEAMDALVQAKVFGLSEGDFYRYKNMVFQLKDNYLFYNSNIEQLNTKNNVQLNDHSENPFYLYLNLQSKPVQTTFFQDEMQKLSFLDDFSIFGNNEQFFFEISTINSKENFLYQLTLSFQEEIKEKLN